MKRILILLLTACMIAAAFVGCAQKPEFGSSSADINGNGLRDDVELKIMKAKYSKMKKIDPKDITVTYYGTYNDAVVLNMRHGELFYDASISKETVAGVTFSYSDSGDRITVWYNEKFYQITAAYELGILTEEDIAKIYKMSVSK